MATLKAKPTRSACHRHRPQRQARADRDRRSRHRDDLGEASVPRRRQSAKRHRVLMPTPALMLQGTGSDVGKSVHRCRPRARLHPSRPARASVQAAEHVEQRGGDARWRRDRPRPGPAGARCPRRAHRRHEPRAAEAASGARRAGDRPRQGQSGDDGGGIPDRENVAAADSARKLRDTRSRGRSGPGRRRRLAGRGQSARLRHRQYGLCPRGRTCRSP